MRGVGKSTWGLFLAEKLGRLYFDTDQILCANYGQKISEIYRRLGEGAFREKELEILKSLQGVSESIISVGGGAVVTAKGRQVLQTLGDLICLHLEKDKLLERWEQMPQYAPMGDSFEECYEQRMDYQRMLSARWVDPSDEAWVEEVLKQYG